jgi:pimeloyl-ACP methyl ester carboxylesterase
MDTTAGTTPLAQLHDRVLAGSAVRSRRIRTGTGERVHILDSGDGPPLVVIHGTASAALFLLPLLERLTGVRSIAVDRPGQGMSDRVALPRKEYRRAAVDWVDRLLDALELDSAAVLGHSMGGRWAMWYALARPERVSRLMVIGVPGLAGTQVPLPFRMLATPGVGEMVQRLSPPDPTSVVRFAKFMGEGATIGAHSDLVNLMVVTGRDPAIAEVDKAEVRALISPLALVSPYGFRRRMRVPAAELRQLAMPTLLMWGEHDPVGSVAAARAAAGQIPDARFEVLPGGHAPWLGHPERTAAFVTDFVGQAEHI